MSASVIDTLRSDPEATALFVDRVGKLSKSLDELIEQAEKDLLGFLRPEVNQFVRRPFIEDGRRQPGPSVSSNAGAIIALESPPATKGIWSDYRWGVIKRLPFLDRRAEGLPRDNVFTSSLVASALALVDAEFPTTLSQDPNEPLPTKGAWAARLLRLVARNGGGVSTESLAYDTSAHSYPTYWAVRALIAHSASIRALDASLDRRLSAMLRWSERELHRAYADKSTQKSRAIESAFALATAWLAEDWLDVGQPSIAPDILRIFYSAQMPDGTWLPGNPFYVKSARTHVYPFPLEACYALFADAAKLLDTKRLAPEDVLCDEALTSFRQLVQWIWQSRHSAPRAPSAGVGRGIAEGWSSSAEPGSRDPECWSTAVVLRTAKALRTVIRRSASDAALSAFAPPKKTVPLQDLVVGERVADYLQDNMVVSKPGQKPKHFSAILAGPPGTGKTLLVQALATQNKMPCLYVGSDYFCRQGSPGLAARIDHAFTIFRLLDEVVVFLDEIDETVLEREGIADESFSRLLTTSMLPRFQELRSSKRVMFFVATNHVQKFDAAIRRAGRFDDVVAVEFPDRKARLGHFLDSCGLSVRESSEGLIDLLANEDGLLQELLGPIVTEEHWADWLSPAVLHRGHRGELCNLFAELYRESLACYRQVSRAARPAFRALHHLCTGDEQVDAPYREALMLAATVEDAGYFLQCALLSSWYGASAVTELDARTDSLRTVDEALELLRVLDDEGRTEPDECTPARRKVVVAAAAALLRVRERWRDNQGRVALKWLLVDDEAAWGRETPDRKCQKQRRALEEGVRLLERYAALLSEPIVVAPHRVVARLTDVGNRDAEGRVRFLETVDQGPSAEQPDLLREHLSSEASLAARRLHDEMLDTGRAALVRHVQGAMKQLEEAAAGLEARDETPQRGRGWSPRASGRDDRRGGVPESSWATVQQTAEALKEWADTWLRDDSRTCWKDSISDVREALERLRRSARGAPRDSAGEMCDAVCAFFSSYVVPAARLMLDAARQWGEAARNVAGLLGGTARAGGIVPAGGTGSLEADDLPVAAEALLHGAGAVDRVFERWTQRLMAVVEAAPGLTEGARSTHRKEVGFPVWFDGVEQAKTFALWKLDPGRITSPQTGSAEMASPRSFLLDLPTEIRAATLAKFREATKVMMGKGSLQLCAVIWRFSRMRALLRRAVAAELSSVWHSSDSIGVLNVPYGLPRSEAPLRLGEFLSLSEVRDAGKELAESMKLTRPGGVTAIYERAESDGDESVIHDLRKNVRQALCSQAARSPFYRDAKAYALDRKGLSTETTDVVDEKTHMPVLSKFEAELLAKRAPLAALRADAEHDRDLADYILRDAT